MVLVCMPFAAVERPSLALGTLAAALGRDGIACRSIHANLDFAALAGRPLYEILNNSDITLQVGEWIFAEAAFGQAGDVDAFVGGLVSCGYAEAGLRDLLLGLRALAARFVDDLAQRIVALRPRMVGCSSMFQQHCASLALLRRLRALDPAVVTMLGGANCEAEMGAATHRAYPWVDFVVSGEADRLLPDLCRSILAHGADMAAALLPAGVLGPASRRAGDGAGWAPADAGRALIDSLDDLPIPDFSDYFAQLAASPLRDHVRAALPIETSRGCWWGAKHHCTFCGLNGSGIGFRSKSPGRVVEEVRTLSGRHGLKKFMATDNILDNKYFASVVPYLAECGDMLWFYETKANLGRAQVAALSRAGIRWIQPGIEALDDDLLKLLNKGCSTAINVQLLKWAYEHGIWVMWNHLYGAPGDRPEWYERVADLLPLIVHLQPPSSGRLTQVRFDRFSPYFNDRDRLGLDLKPCWGYGQVYPLPAELLEQQAYFFRNATPPAPPPARLTALLRDWADRFYAASANPAALARRSDHAPVLTMAGGGPRLTIRDTRPCAVAERHDLTALEGRICHALDGALGEQALAQALERAGAGATAAETAQALRRLVDRKIVADFAGKFLCLATAEHPVPYRSFADFAGGLLNIAARPAAPGRDRPWDVPVKDLFAAP